MEKGNIFGVMDQFMMENGWKIKLMDKVNIYGQMEDNILVNG